MTVTAYFDLDGTLISGDSDVLFHLHMVEAGRVTPALAAAMHDMMDRYVAGELTMDRFREFQRVRASEWSPEEYATAARACFHTRVRPTFFPEARAWIDAHRSSGHRVVLISAGTHPIVVEAGRYVAADAAYGCEVVAVDGKFTGVVRDPMPYADGKIAVAEMDAASAGVRLGECFFYSDNIADLPLLSAVGHPCVVSPNPALETVATERQWPIYRPTPA